MMTREFTQELEAERFQRYGVSREQLCEALDILSTVIGREVDRGVRFRRVWAFYRRLPGWVDPEEILLWMDDYQTQCARGWDQPAVATSERTLRAG